MMKNKNGDETLYRQPAVTFPREVGDLCNSVHFMKSNFQKLQRM